MFVPAIAAEFPAISVNWKSPLAPRLKETLLVPAAPSPPDEATVAYTVYVSDVPEVIVLGVENTKLLAPLLAVPSEIGVGAPLNTFPDASLSVTFVRPVIEELFPI